MLNVLFYSVVEVLSGLRADLSHVSHPAACSTESAWAANGAWEHLSRWNRSRRNGAEYFPASCRRATRLAICSRPSPSGRSSRTGAGAPMFFIGGLPALLTLFIRAKVKESDAWKAASQRKKELERLFRAVARELEAVPVSRRADGHDELHVARHAGPVSDVSSAPAAISTPRTTADRQRRFRWSARSSAELSWASIPTVVGRRRAMVTSALLGASPNSPVGLFVRRWSH